MRKSFLVFLIFPFPLSVFASIDESKADIYFANGIQTEEKDARYNAEKVLEPSILYGVYGGSLQRFDRSIGKVDYAYNSTHGWGAGDLIESAIQKGVTDSIILRIIYNLMTDFARAKDLILQVQKYKGSIEAGHKVLVVAHSQGNFFTNEACDQLVS